MAPIRPATIHFIIYIRFASQHLPCPTISQMSAIIRPATRPERAATASFQPRLVSSCLDASVSCSHQRRRRLRGDAGSNILPLNNKQRWLQIHRQTVLVYFAFGPPNTSCDLYRLYLRAAAKLIGAIQSPAKAIPKKQEPDKSRAPSHTALGWSSQLGLPADRITASAND